MSIEQLQKEIERLQQEVKDLEKRHHESAIWAFAWEDAAMIGPSFLFRKNDNLYYRKEDCNMTRKQIDAAREARLWIGQIVVPTLTVVATTMAIPEVRQAIAAKAKSVKQSIEQKMKKES